MTMSDRGRSGYFPRTLFGIHTGLANTTPAELRLVWTLVDSLGFDWVSIFDHLYSANGTGGTDCLESVSMHCLLASTTTRVRCGCLVYVPSYRHPAILAKAASTMDSLSGGRITVGLGAGWHRREYASMGLEFGDNRTRLRQLDEAYSCVDLLLNSPGPVSFAGRYFQLADAYCEPRPIQDRVPIWIGGGGERYTLATAARADGWNVPFISPEEFARKRSVLAAHCDRIGRDVSDILCSVNVGLAWSPEQMPGLFGRHADKVSPAVLQGSPDRMRDHIQAYVDAGADQVNIAVRAEAGIGYDLDTFDRLAELLYLSSTPDTIEDLLSTV